MKEHFAKLPGSLVNTMEDCVALLENELEQGSEVDAPNETQPSLLQQCEQLISADQGQKEPIRTLHHFACTGGTLISKCLASMPNTQVLSEVEPHSRLDADKKFAPTDLIQLLRMSSRPSSLELESKVFLAALDAIYQDCNQKGLRLVLRDHAHSRYCHGDIEVEVPSLRQIVAAEYEALSIVTVRHPLDSYLSLVNEGWLHFSPQTIDEYAKRYLEFISD